MITTKDEPHTLDHESVVVQRPPPQTPLNGHLQKAFVANGQITELGLPGTPDGIEDELPDSSVLPEHHPIISSVPHGDPPPPRLAFETPETCPSSPTRAGKLPPLPEPVFLKPVPPAPVGGLASPSSIAENGSRHISEAVGGARNVPRSGAGAKTGVLAAVRFAEAGKKKVSWPDLHGSSLIAVREFEASDSELSDSEGDDDDSEGSQSCACVIQ
ncbi:hypothetical protein KFL_002200110 [Klebsormidium nitens]|uniref:Uncharacterized protein n=1 Tax=Klebsormidium nitens TaxID=105231 RepID=A0A1Y1I8V1_KLENI|nr:hypothetical protein KFL_002200110 [Klebsormidium nitens]|eukprot:GAQ85126.1 hypothetical protein KFL_002200110 [Klebsormidium nitens]